MQGPNPPMIATPLVRLCLKGASFILHLIVVTLAGSINIVDYKSRRTTYIGVGFAAAGLVFSLGLTPFALVGTSKKENNSGVGWREMLDLSFQVVYSIVTAVTEIVQVAIACDESCHVALPALTAAFALLNALILTSWLLIDLRVIFRAKAKARTSAKLNAEAIGLDARLDISLESISGDQPSLQIQVDTPSVAESSTASKLSSLGDQIEALERQIKIYNDELQTFSSFTPRPTTLSSNIPGSDLEPTPEEPLRSTNRSKMDIYRDIISIVDQLEDLKLQRNPVNYRKPVLQSCSDESKGKVIPPASHDSQETGRLQPAESLRRASRLLPSPPVSIPVVHSHTEADAEGDKGDEAELWQLVLPKEVHRSKTNVGNGSNWVSSSYRPHRSNERPLPSPPIRHVSDTNRQSTFASRRSAVDLVSVLQEYSSKSSSGDSDKLDQQLTSYPILQPDHIVRYDKGMHEPPPYVSGAAYNATAEDGKIRRRKVFEPSQGVPRNST